MMGEFSKVSFVLELLLLMGSFEAATMPRGTATAGCAMMALIASSQDDRNRVIAFTMSVMDRILQEFRRRILWLGPTA